MPGAAAAAISAKDAAADSQQRHFSAANGVRQKYGRLHTASFRVAAALVEPLASLEALTPPLLDVLVNIAVRRAGNEAPAAVAVAAAAYNRAGVTDPRVTQAFLEAAVAARRRHAGGGGDSGSDSAAASAGHIAEVLGFCNKAGWYDPRAFAEAADALVAYGVGTLTLRQTWFVLRGFAGTRHSPPLLISALATHAKTLFPDAEAPAPSLRASTVSPATDRDCSTVHVASQQWQRPWETEDVVDMGEGSTEHVDDGMYGSSADPLDSGDSSLVSSVTSRRYRKLGHLLRTLAGLVHSFSTMEVYDTELYDRLAAGAADLLLHDSAAARLFELQPRATAAAVTTLLAGFASAGVHPGRLLEALMAGQRPLWVRYLSVGQWVSE